MAPPPAPQGQFTSPKIEPPFDHYFSLWTLTEKGLKDPDAVDATFAKASAMIQRYGGRCHLYLAVGGDCDFIGEASGKNIDDVAIMSIQQAIKGFGTLETTFIKGRELSIGDLKKFISTVKDLGTSKRNQ